jgi:ferredoxin
MNDINHVWIEAGCIACHACTQAAPEVFQLESDRAEVLAAVRCDSATCHNEDKRSPLNSHGIELLESIKEAAAGCPVDVIRLEMAGV